MKKSYPLTLIALLVFNLHSFSQTTLTEDVNGILNATRIYTQTSSGQIFFQGHQLGSSYGFPYGIFRAITDNPTGVSNYFYDGVANGITNFSVRADGQGYFAGNVGIGTTTPMAQLDVAKNVIVGSAGDKFNTPLTLIKNGDSYGTDNSVFLIKHSGNGSNVFGNPVSDLGIIRIQGFSTLVANKAINSNDNFYVFTNGTVGINTSYVPFGYQLAIAGSAIATSMTVKLQANWPDYVFEKDYQLLPLTEVKAYIDQHQHLPEMPSELEIKKDGLNLGEMNKILTKKVEELTLYLIEKDGREKEENKINLSQQQEINELKQQVNKLIQQFSKN